MITRWLLDLRQKQSGTPERQMNTTYTHCNMVCFISLWRNEQGQDTDVRIIDSNCLKHVTSLGYNFLFFFGMLCQDGMKISIGIFSHFFIALLFSCGV